MKIYAYLWLAPLCVNAALSVGNLAMYIKRYKTIIASCPTISHMEIYCTWLSKTTKLYLCFIKMPIVTLFIIGKKPCKQFKCSAKELFSILQELYWYNIMLKSYHKRYTWEWCKSLENSLKLIFCETVGHKIELFQTFYIFEESDLRIKIWKLCKPL